MKSKVLIKELKENFPGQEEFESRILNEADIEIKRVIKMKSYKGKLSVASFRVLLRQFGGWYDSLKDRAEKAELSWGLLPVSGRAVLSRYEKKHGIVLDVKSHSRPQQQPKPQQGRKHGHKGNLPKDELVDA